MANLWQWISYYRHRSELWALNLAMRAPFLAMLPIMIVIFFWWAVATLPIVLAALLLVDRFGLLGQIFLALLAIPAIAAILFAAPWYGGWYEVAVRLMFSRSAPALAKQQALEEAILTYRTKAR